MSAREYLKAYPCDGGTEFDVDVNGVITQLTRKYFFLRPKGTAQLAREQLSDVTGLPPIGSAYDSSQYSYLLANAYKVSQGESSECEKYLVTVTFTDGRGDGNNIPFAGQAEQSLEFDGNSETQDLITDQGTGDPLLNSAGDTFESVPQREVVTPLIRRTLKTNTNPASFLEYSGCVNNSAITLFGWTIPAHCARLKVSGHRLYGEKNFSYEVTFEIATVSRFAKINGTSTQIGWDFAILDAGFNYLDADNKKVRATESNDETKEPKPTAKTVLLTSAGRLLESGGTPHVFRIQGYNEMSGATMSSYFTSATV